MVHLENKALLVALAGLTATCHESGTGGVLEDFADTIVALGRALEVLVGHDLLTDLLTLLGGDGLLAGLAELLNGLLVVSQILLAADEDDGQALAEVQNLRDPLLLNVVQRIGRVNSKADQDDV